MSYATVQYEDRLLDEILDRVMRDQEIKELLKSNKNKAKQKIDTEMIKCYQDPVYFIESYLYTEKNENFFSDRIGKLVPYLLFDYQVQTVDATIACIEKKEKIFLEKSRQMGISWLYCAIALWGWLFRDWKILFLSQKEDFVDKIGDMQSLFQKIRFMTKRLPKWMLPRGFSIEKHMPRLRIIKPEGQGTGSITGDSSNTNAGTGGTYKIIFLDEFSKMLNAKSINTSVQAACIGSIIYNGTPFGKFNEHYKMRKIAQKGEMKLIRLHWRLNPMYTEEWYEEKTRGMLAEDIAQEYEIDYEGSVTGRVYPNFGNMPKGDCLFYKFEYDPYLPTYISIDNSHGGNDNHAIIVAQTTLNGKIRIVDSHQLPPRTTISECASLLALKPIGEINDETYQFLNRLKGYKKATYIADPYDTKSTWNDTSILKVYRNYGITLLTPERSKSKQDQIRIVRMAMDRVEINLNQESTTDNINWEFATCIQSARYPEQKEGSQSTAEKSSPVHDGTSHFRTSFEYLINFIVEIEEALGIVGGMRQPQREKVLVEKANHITGEIELVLE